MGPLSGLLHCAVISEELRTRVKICGITNLEDALAACECGADAIGFVFFEKSPRFIKSPEAAAIAGRLPPFVTRVGVFVNETEERIRDVVREARIDCVQLHGDEGPGFCERIRALGARVIKAVRVKDERSIGGLGHYRVSAFLLDTFRQGTPGGTGEVFDWEVARKAKAYGPVILSGGLTPENVSDATGLVRPYGVDVSSGVEERPGKKDAAKVARFIEEARRHDIT